MVSLFLLADRSNSRARSGARISLLAISAFSESLGAPLRGDEPETRKMALARSHDGSPEIRMGLGRSWNPGIVFATEVERFGQ